MSTVLQYGRLPVTLLMILLYCSCVHSGRVDRSAENSVNGAIMVDEKTAGSLQLADYLRRVPGVLVYGSGENMQVRIRGVSSLYLGVDPLYVVNSQIVGTRYSEVDSMINLRDIKHIRVLKGSDAAIYGVRGANGVIIITTRD